MRNFSYWLLMSVGGEKNKSILCVFRRKWTPIPDGDGYPLQLIVDTCCRSAPPVSRAGMMIKGLIRNAVIARERYMSPQKMARPLSGTGKLSPSDSGEIRFRLRCTSRHIRLFKRHRGIHDLSNADRNLRIIQVGAAHRIVSYAQF